MSNSKVFNDTEEYYRKQQERIDKANDKLEFKKIVKGNIEKYKDVLDILAKRDSDTPRERKDFNKYIENRLGSTQAELLLDKTVRDRIGSIDNPETTAERLDRARWELNSAVDNLVSIEIQYREELKNRPVDDEF